MSGFPAYDALCADDAISGFLTLRASGGSEKVLSVLLGCCVS
jgi:hypothetical protein